MSEITKTRRPAANPIPTIAWMALAVLVIIFYFFGLSIPLLGPDEPRYAQVAREMWQRGDWITPTLAGHTWFEKPALLYWLEIAGYNIFGVTEYAARVGSAVFGLGTVASLWILGRSVGKEFANWLALIGASTLGIMVFARGASFDIIVTFPITAALVGFYLFDQAKTRSFRSKYLPLITFYFFIGVALLAKGLIGIIFPFAIVGVYYLFSRRLPERTFVISLFWGTLISMAVAAAWYLPMYQRHGYEFIDQFFIQHHFQRFTSNKYQHPQPFYFFFWVLPLMTLPWMPLFLASLWQIARGIFKRGDAETRSNDGETVTPVSPSLFLPFSPTALLHFCLAWLVVPLLFFSMSGSKLPGYILPSVPAALVITARYVYRLASKSRNWRNALFAVAPATIAIGMLVLIFAVPKFAESDSVKSLIDAANSRGYTSERVFTLHTISHNAEFYAAGRLQHETSGRQKRYPGVTEIRDEILATGGTPVLVLVPLEYLQQLLIDPRVSAELIKDNGDLAIVYVKAK